MDGMVPVRIIRAFIAADTTTAIVVAMLLQVLQVAVGWHLLPTATVGTDMWEEVLVKTILVRAIQ